VTDFTDAPRDPLDDLLVPPPAAAEPLRRRVWEQTVALLRRRRRRRLAVAAACFAASAAVLLSWWWATTPRPALDPSIPPEGRITAGSFLKPLSPSFHFPPDPPPSALAEEWQAFDSTAGRAERYRKAGDRYLTEDADPASAVRCYGAALDAGGEADRAVSPGDSWLLMVIKDAREKEKTDGKKGL
jgi:hypothetical protein